jgi:LuxR family transcriptional activator of conjugal transfer of Ti plasmids
MTGLLSPAKAVSFGPLPDFRIARMAVRGENVLFHPELLDTLDNARDRSSLLDAMTRVVAAIDVPVFAYLGWTDPDTPLLIANYSPAWRARFVAENYDKIDPVRATAQIARLPFHWRAADYVGRSSRVQRQMFDEAAEFGVTRGITVPIRHNHGRVTTLTMAADGTATSFSRNAEKHRHFIHLVALHFDANITSKLGLDTGRVAPKLSPREIECLRWAARGKSTFETAAILAIMRRTVVFHLENAKRKLGVTTTRQAIVEALRRGALSDESI